LNLFSIFLFLFDCLFFQKAALVWSPAPEAAHAHVSKPSPNSGTAGTPPTPAQTPVGVGGAAGSTGGHQQQQQQQQLQQQQQQQQLNNNHHSAAPNHPHHHHHHAHNHHHAHHPHGPSGSSSSALANNNNNNPPAPSQPQAGLMHWMSVMAEHMTSANPHHHDVHYMWNGVEVNNQNILILFWNPSTTTTTTLTRDG
jgi:hypothetical protein